MGWRELGEGGGEGGRWGTDEGRVWGVRVVGVRTKVGSLGREGGREVAEGGMSGGGGGREVREGGGVERWGR